MSSIRLVFLVTLFAAIVLAVPTKSVRNIQKRSFVVGRSINQNHPTRRYDGPAALRKVSLKYNLGLKGGFIAAEKTSSAPAAPAAPKTLATNSTAGTGSVAANPQDNAALFLSPVKVGGQTLNLDFDSGSSDLWMFSTQQPASQIGGHTAFDASKSTSFAVQQGKQFSISYGDGSGAAGVVGTDTVDIGGAVVNNQTVELATAVSQSFQQDTATDGLVGLAFSQLNTVNDGTKKTPAKTFFDNVMPSLAMPVFTADLAVDGSGSYQFGAIDQSKISGQMAWVPVNASSGFWQVDSTKFAVNGKVQNNPTGSKAIADTGTSLLLVDQNVATAYYSQVQGAKNDAQVGGFTYPCNAQLPDMAVALGSYMANIPGNMLTFAAVDAANTTCFGGVQGNQGAGMQIYGDVMFRSQLVAFNGGNQTLGLALKKTAASAMTSKIATS